MFTWTGLTYPVSVILCYMARKGAATGLFLPLRTEDFDTGLTHQTALTALKMELTFMRPIVF